MISCVEGVKDH